MQSGPLEIRQDLGFSVLYKTFLVGVFDPENETSTSPFREEIAKERCPQASDV
jgi:hypothetical protein